MPSPWCASTNPHTSHTSTLCAVRTARKPDPIAATTLRLTLANTRLGSQDTSSNVVARAGTYASSNFDNGYGAFFMPSVHPGCWKVATFWPYLGSSMFLAASPASLVLSNNAASPDLTSQSGTVACRWSRCMAYSALTTSSWWGERSADEKLYCPALFLPRHAWRGVSAGAARAATSLQLCVVSPVQHSHSCTPPAAEQITSNPSGK